MDSLSKIVIDGLTNIPKIKSIKKKMNTFYKAYNSVIDSDLIFWYRDLDYVSGSETSLKGKKMLMLDSYDYLGLGDDPQVKKAVSDTVLKHGLSTGGSRLLTGSTIIHKQLENSFAEYKGTESAIVFNSGYDANLTTISTLFGNDDLVILDKYDHASIYDGARLSGARIERFEHNNVDSLAQILESSGDYENKLVVIDAVYSSVGDLAKLPEIIKIIKKHGAISMVDEAHCLGIIGKTGRGINEHFGLKIEDVDIWMTSLGKAFGSQGGVIAGNDDIISYLKVFGRSFIFSGSLPAAVNAGTLEAINIMKSDLSRKSKLWENIKHYKEGLDDMGYDTMNTESAVIPIYLGDEANAIKMARVLNQEGIFACPYIYPAVPPKTARFRTLMTTNHSSEEIEYALKGFQKAKKKVKL